MNTPVSISAKEVSLKLIERLDDDVSFEDIMYELHILKKIKMGLLDVEQENTTAHDMVKEEFKKWKKPQRTPQSEGSCR